MSPGAPGRGRRALRPLRALAALALAAAACALALWRWLPPRTWVDTSRFVRTRDALSVVDRHGRPLRHARVDGIDRRWAPLSEISPTLIDAVLAAEDSRFRQHGGVDARATARAALTNLVPWRQRSGASTLTQQLVKRVYGRPAGVFSKAIEIVRAMALERLLSKDEILEQYLNRLPFGDQIEGVGRASEAYFGHPVASLTAAEAALLAAIPRAPTVTEPRRHLDRALRRRAVVLGRMRALGLLDDAAHEAALREPARIADAPARPDEASRFVDRALALDRLSSRAGPALRTTLDLDLQRRAERLLDAPVERLSARGARNAAAIVVANDTGEVLAYVGAARRAAPGGALDLLQRRRQAGSTLKPFVYELLFEKGATAATVLDDIVTPLVGAHQSQFEARDYDGKERGPVRARVALASSLNLAALDAAGRVGQDAIVARLGALGLRGLGKADRYGAAAVLGSVDVAPADLALAYAALAREGRPARLSFSLPAPTHAAGPPLLDPAAAAVVTDILSDRVARSDAFGSDLAELSPQAPFALKTGTSSGWRDAWAAVYSPAFTVVVWLGDPDGTPMAGVSGFEAAAPAAARILAAAHERAAANGVDDRRRPAARLLPAQVCAWSGRRPGPRCGHTVSERFAPGTQPTEVCDEHDDEGAIRLRPRLADWAQRTRPAGVSDASLDPPGGLPLQIREPADGSRLLIDPARGETRPRLRAFAGGVEVRDVRWEADGQPVGPGGWAAQAGEHTLMAVRGATRSAPVRVSVREPEPRAP